MKLEQYTVITADDGKVLTDGEIFAKTVMLPKERTEDEFHEITEAEYSEIVKKQEEELIDGVTA